MKKRRGKTMTIEKGKDINFHLGKHFIEHSIVMKEKYKNHKKKN